MISVVVPAFREGSGVTRAIDEISAVLQDQADEFEIIVVDDGSPDDTFACAQQKAQEMGRVRVLRHAENRGPGAAFRTGFAASQGDCVVTIDCDLSFDPRQIPMLLRELHAGADVAIGAQHGPGAAMVNVPLPRVACSKIAYWADRVVLGGRLGSYSSFFVAYRGDLIRSLVFDANGFDAQCEILARLLHKGAQIRSVPARLAWRDRRRTSSIKLFREARRRMRIWRGFHRWRTHGTQE